MADDAKKLSLFEKIGNFFDGVKAEYSKIIFPAKETLRKQTIAVIIVSVLIGAVIFALDFIMRYLLGFVL
ncbi:MAG: preprotein translocase subunit SecE [Eubacteriales bacterium]|nr:preprotein translocase subunit SecE [Eubacteriales bacterium]